MMTKNKVILGGMAVIALGAVSILGGRFGTVPMTFASMITEPPTTEIPTTTKALSTTDINGLFGKCVAKNPPMRIICTVMRVIKLPVFKFR